MKTYFKKGRLFLILPFLLGCSSAPQQVVVRYPSSSEDISQEILNLQDNALLPAEAVSTLSSQEIGRLLVTRLRSIEKSKEGNCDVTNPNYFNYREHGILQMRFSAKNIPLIGKNGFINRHQKGLSCPSCENLSRLEDQLAGVQLEGPYSFQTDNPTNNIRPKYAFLAFKESANAFKYKTSDFVDYGDSVAVFKDEIKDRATFTPADSLGTKGRDHHTFDYCEMTPLVPTANYWEAQIWGEVTLDDVDHFLVNCPKSSKVATKSEINEMKKLGKPIYKCIFVKNAKNLSIALGKGSLVFKGNSVD